APPPARRWGPSFCGPRGASDDQPIDHDGRRRDRVRAWLERRDPESRLEIHATVATEPRAGPTVSCVQRDQLSMRIGDEDPATALSACGSRLVEPGRDTAAREV